MAFDWPNTPTLNQQVIGPDGQLYRWDGVKWIAAASGPWAPQLNTTSIAQANNYSPFDIDGGTY